MPSRPMMPPPKARHARARLPHQNGRSSSGDCSGHAHRGCLGRSDGQDHPVARAMAQSMRLCRRIPHRFVLPAWAFTVAGRPAYRAVADLRESRQVGRRIAPGTSLTGARPSRHLSWARSKECVKRSQLDQIDPAGLFLTEIAAGDEDACLRAYAGLACEVSAEPRGDQLWAGHERRSPMGLWRPGAHFHRGLAAHRNAVPRSGALATSPGCGPSALIRPGASPAASWWPGRADQRDLDQHRRPRPSAAATHSQASSVRLFDQGPPIDP